MQYFLGERGTLGGMTSSWCVPPFMILYLLTLICIFIPQPYLLFTYISLSYQAEQGMNTEYQISGPNLG